MGSGAISAALIVRDEAQYLEDCLNSIADLVDEIVVVDTGSQDESRKIARDGGAKLFEFAWTGDFSAARNQALDHASGEWILYIDADERVRNFGRDDLVPILSRDDAVAYTVRFHPRPGYTAYPEYRIFRNDPRFRYSGVIHESNIRALKSAARDEGKSIPHCELTIDHIGYEGDQKRKHARNLPLLLRQVQVDPGRTYLWWHLGFIYRETGRLEEAQAVWEKGILPARKGRQRTNRECLCFGELAKLHYDQGRDPMPIVNEGLSLFPHNRMLQWIKGKLLAAQKDYDAAADIFESLAKVDPETFIDDTSYDARLFGADAMIERGKIELARERKAEAAHWFALAAKHRDLMDSQ